MSQPTPAVGPLKESPDGFALRGRPRPVVRFRRGLIVGVTGAIAATLITLSWFALEPPSFHKVLAPIDTDEPSRKAGPEALANLPGNYGEVPRLGPPLPGDLGRPILEQQRSIEVTQPPIGNAVSTSAELTATEARREQLAAARQAARSSAVLFQLEAPRNLNRAEQPQPEATPAIVEPTASPASVPAGELRKIEFARSPDDDQNPHALRAAPSPWTLSAGTVIPASLITGLNSDLPGMVMAQVSANVRDSATGRTILIPQGARLIGSYDSLVAYGQRRALLIWTRLVFSDGSSVRLDNMPAADASGYAGLEDAVDSHGWQLLKGIGLSTLLGVSTHLSLGGEGDLVRAIRESAQKNAAGAGARIAARNLDVQPTIKVRPGWPVRAILNKDLVLQPWRA